MAAGPFVIDGRVEEAKTFTTRQQALLDVLATHSFRSAFLHYGIPVEVRDRRRWLGLESPGPMERIVEAKIRGKKRNWPVWLCLRVQQASEPDDAVDVDKLLSQSLTPTQLVEVKLEYAYNAYSLRLGPAQEAQQLAKTHSAELVGWAREYIAYMVRIFRDFGGTLNGGSLATPRAMEVLIAQGLVDEIGPEYDILLEPYHPTVLARLSASRREAIACRSLRECLTDDSDALWRARPGFYAETIFKHTELFATAKIATLLFDIRDNILKRDFETFLDVVALINKKAPKVDAAHEAFHAVVQQRLKATQSSSPKKAASKATPSKKTASKKTRK